MTMIIIDRFKFIHIHEQDGNAMLTALGALELNFGMFEEMAAVVQPCKRIGIGDLQ